MKKRIFTFTLVSFIGLMFIAAGVLLAAGPTDPPDVVKIENQGYKRDKKGFVQLSHAKHNKEYGVKCEECHHDYKDGKNIWKEGDPVKKCVECHDPNKKVGKKKKLQLAFHTDCKDCHKAEHKKGKKNTPYKKCNDCHHKK